MKKDGFGTGGSRHAHTIEDGSRSRKRRSWREGKCDCLEGGRTGLRERGKKSFKHKRGLVKDVQLKGKRSLLLDDLIGNGRPITTALLGFRGGGGGGGRRGREGEQKGALLGHGNLKEYIPDQGTQGRPKERKKLLEHPGP